MSAGSPAVEWIDHSGLRTHQAVLIGLLMAGFIADEPGMVGFTAAMMVLGTFRGTPAFLPAYRLLREVGWVKPDLMPDHAQPHRFAHLLGTVFLISSVIAFPAKWTTLGWLLAGLVAFLAAINLFLGFCFGCAVYYWLGRWGLHPPAFKARLAEQDPKLEGRADD
ncbi:MAG: DUF4395 domain-containing protein [Anaerolineales bacterium]